jgi:hypothetical protein
MINTLLVLLVILALLVPALCLIREDASCRMRKSAHADALNQRGRKVRMR